MQREYGMQPRSSQTTTINDVVKMSSFMELRDALFAALTSLVVWLLIRVPYLNTEAHSHSSLILSNGTHQWSPTVLLISLDGFKPSYLSSGLVPTINALSKGGRVHSQPVSSISAEYMLPVSPSLTFPNHWTLQTGLQPSSHGIVANNFHLTPHTDGRLRKNSSFYYTDPGQSWDPKWWKGSPIWEHLEQKGIVTANLMWPGPPVTARDVRSTHFQRYEKGWTVEKRSEKIFDWLDLDAADRPHFVCAYAPDVDTATHDFGPDTSLAPVSSALRAVDRFIEHILQGIAERNATEIVNVVVVSDHGMTFTSNDRLLYLDEILGPQLLSKAVTIDGWPNVGLRFRTGDEYHEAWRRLENEKRRRDKLGQHAFDVISREDLVRRWNWTMTGVVRDRMAELWMLPVIGWGVTTHEEMQSFNYDYIPRGNHGYDATHPDMHALFVASGPAIRPRSAASIAPFANVEIHNLVMRMLGVEGAPNNGTKGFWSSFIRSPLEDSA